MAVAIGNQRGTGQAVLIVLSLWCAGCLQVERTNPLDSNPALLIASRPAVLQPTGFEQWYVDTRQQIIWDPGETEIDPTVSLRLSLDNGATFPHVIVTDTPNTGRLDWRIPDLPSAQCRIQIVYSDSINTGRGTFAILRKPIPIQRTFEGGEWPSWRNDRLAFMSNRSGNYDIYVLSGTVIDQVTTDGAFDGYPSFDSKGFHLSFTSDRTGRNEIWATERFFTQDNRVLYQLTTNGGSHSYWRQQPRAQRLVFISVSPNLSSIPIPNISTLIFANGLTSDLSITDIRLRSDSGFKERPTWVETTEKQFIYYKQPGFGPNIIKRIRIEDTTEDLPPENVVLPFPPDVSVRNPAISQNVARIAVSIDGDIWVLTIEDGEIIGTPLQITFDPADDDLPDWRGDEQLAFQSNRTGRWEIYTVDMP